MSSVFESYEQQFATITADITSRIGRIPNLTGSRLHVVIYVHNFGTLYVDFKSWLYV